MRSVALLTAIAVLGGVYAGIAWGQVAVWAPLLLAAAWAAAVVAWLRHASRGAVVLTTAGYFVGGFALGAAATDAALNPTLRTVLDARYGGFTLGTMGPPGIHPPLLVRARLEEDAAVEESGASFVARVEAVALDGEWRSARGTARFAVSGSIAAQHTGRWRAGRVIEAPVTFRRPARYLNDGVADFERALALGGVALNASVKSALLVVVVEPGTAFQEAAADVRACVRGAVQRRVGAHDAIAAAIVTAILIGDRTMLPAEVGDRLRAAGTYHVIAISGGNIAILAALMTAMLAVTGVRGRLAALVVIAALAAYAGIVDAGPSVTRATLMAIVYLSARLFDHRSSPWHAMAVSAALLASVEPLDTREVGFALTFGATAALLEAGRRIGTRRGPAFWVVACVVASFATEIALLPVGATAFSRVTFAGLALNLAAVPLMTVIQLAGLAVVFLDPVEWAARSAGFLAAVAAQALTESARLVEVLPWLERRVPPPPTLLVCTYYAALAFALWSPRMRRAAAVVLVACAMAMLGGISSAGFGDAPAGGRLRMTMFDVGQGDAVLVQAAGLRLMVDAGGTGFDGAASDIGGRVLAPALWRRAARRLDALAVTHGDPDHIGGALALLRDFAPSEIWQGVPMPHHPPSQALMAAAGAAGVRVHQRLAGWRTARDDVVVRVLHPPAPDWERPRVRNDDSLVIEVRYGEVSVLLTGDISSEVEAQLIPTLSPARVRILKVAHHGSRTSTSAAFLDAWKPQLALISCGRGNRFGHPAREVLDRLARAGARIYRTDRDGQITIETDGRHVAVRTYVAHMPRPAP